MVIIGALHACAHTFTLIPLLLGNQGRDRVVMERYDKRDSEGEGSKRQDCMRCEKTRRIWWKRKYMGQCRKVTSEISSFMSCLIFNLVCRERKELSPSLQPMYSWAKSLNASWFSNHQVGLWLSWAASRCECDDCTPAKRALISVKLE